MTSLPNRIFSHILLRRISWCLITTAAVAGFHLSAAESPIVLGQAADFAVLAGAGITNTGPTTIIGDVGSLPTATMTGFGSVTLTGINHGGDAITLSGKGDLLTAFNDAAGRLPTIIYAPIADLGGLTLAPGVHTDSSSFGITGTLTLDAMGNPNAVWVFQAGSTLITAAGSSINLINGAQAANVFWQVGSSATLGVNSAFIGSILANTDITLNTGATLDGRALALNGAVTMDSNNIAMTPLLVNGPTHWLGAASGLWTTAGNWAVDVAGTPSLLVPSALDNITFSANGAANQSTNLGADFTINTLTIKDPAAVTIAGANTLTLAGDPGLTINAGAGLVTISSGLAFTGSAPLVTVNNTAGAIFSGVVTSAGSLIKAGTGSLGISGATTVTGPASIAAGTLNILTGGSFTALSTTVAAGSTVSVAGALNSPAVNIQAGGNLDGTGIITGNVMNLGTVNPGAAVGALTINGTYTQGGSGLLATELVTPANHDQLLISGAANLGGTLVITTAGGLRPNLGDSFDIIQAGNVAGQFATVVNPFAGPGTLVNLVVVYTPTAVFVNAVQNSFGNALSLIPLTPNQTAVAGALDSALNDVRQAPVLAYLNGLNINAVPQQLEKIAPEELTAIYSIAFAQLDTEIMSVQQRLSSIRSAGWSEPVAEQTERTSGKDVYPVSGLSPTISPNNYRYGFFANATGQYASLGNTANANGFDVQSVGSTIGADVRLNDNWVLGVTLGYARSNSDLTDGGRLTADGMRAAVYAMYMSGAFYTELMVGGSFNSYDTRRSALGGMATGNTNSTSYDAYIGTGYNIQVNQWTFTPMASLRYTHVNIDSFEESGSLQPLRFGSQSQESLRSRIGLRAAYTALVGAARVTPSLSMQWQHEFLYSQLGITSQFANGAGNPFTAYGPRIGRDSALVTAGMNVAWSRYAVYLAYQAELFRTNYQSHTVFAGFRVSW